MCKLPKICDIIKENAWIGLDQRLSLVAGKTKLMYQGFAKTSGMLFTYIIDASVRGGSSFIYEKLTHFSRQVTISKIN